jgi:hypothetical protein
LFFTIFSPRNKTKFRGGGVAFLPADQLRCGISEAIHRRTAGGRPMNNMNEWITHLQHPLVLAGFGLFVFALIIKPLFLNSKKLTGPAPACTAIIISPCIKS